MKNGNERLVDVGVMDDWAAAEKQVNDNMEGKNTKDPYWNINTEEETDSSDYDELVKKNFRWYTTGRWVGIQQCIAKTPA